MPHSVALQFELLRPHSRMRPCAGVRYIYGLSRIRMPRTVTDDGSISQILTGWDDWNAEGPESSNLFRPP